MIASIGERTCETCGALDGKRFKLSDKQDGVNFPPLHPNCRCTTIAYDPDDNLEDLKAGELEYEEWYKKYVTDRARQPEKLSTSGQKMLTNSGEGGIMDIDENERQFRNKLYNGLVNTTIEHRAQLNHTLSPEWRNSVKQALKAIAEGKKQKPKSRLFRQFDPQLLATAFCGKGELEYRNGSDSFDEFVELSFDVGVTYDSKIGKYVPTNILQIKYGKNGVHVFPTIRKR